MKYDKLVRDKIPEIIKQKGGVPVTHIAGEEQYWEKLKQKMFEELEEFKKDESPEEIADLFEVIDAVIEYKKFDREKIAGIRQKKAVERGVFNDRIILEES